MVCEIMEIWKDISEYEGLYQASNLGNIRGLDRIIRHEQGGRIVERKIQGKVKNTRQTRTGYLICNLSKNGVLTTKSVSILVKEAFRGKPEKGYEIDHKDENKLNNKLENLEYVTRKENINRSFNNGRKIASGDAHYRAKLCKADVEFIRSNKGLFTGRHFASMFGVCSSTISLAINGKNWSHVS